MRVVAEDLARMAKIEAHFEISDIVDRHILMLRHSVVPLLLDHCKANFCALTGTPLTLETVTTFLFQLDYYSTFNTSPSQITRTLHLFKAIEHFIIQSGYCRIKILTSW